MPLRTAAAATPVATAPVDAAAAAQGRKTRHTEATARLQQHGSDALLSLRVARLQLPSQDVPRRRFHVDLRLAACRRLQPRRRDGAVDSVLSLAPLAAAILHARVRQRPLVVEA